MKATTKMTGGIAALGLVLALSITARAQQLSITPTVLDAHPTVAEFREEIARADAVVLGKIVKVLRRKGGKLADQDALIKVIRSYKGKLPEAQPCVRMEINQAMERKTGDRLADVGDEVILPIEFVHPCIPSPEPSPETDRRFITWFRFTTPSSRTARSVRRLVFLPACAGTRDSITSKN